MVNSYLHYTIYYCIFQMILSLFYIFKKSKTPLFCFRRSINTLKAKKDKFIKFYNIKRMLEAFDFDIIGFSLAFFEPPLKDTTV